MTKKKTTNNKKGKIRDNLVTRKSSGKSALPRKIKSILATPEAKLVLFEKDKRQIKILPKTNKEINISIVNSPLDFYTSPHLMDLSAFKHIEKIKPNENKLEVGYADLPGGKILHKIGIFHFIMLENSEILKVIKKIAKTGLIATRMALQKAKLSSNLEVLPGNKSSKDGVWDHLRQISFINFIWFFLSQFGKFFIFANWLIKYSVYGLKSLFAQDEVINFSSKQQPLFDSLQSNLNQLAVNYNEDYYFDPNQVKSYSTKLIADFGSGAEKERIDKKKNINKKLNKPRTIVFRYSNIFKPALAFVVVALLVMLPFKISSYWQKVTVVRGQVLGQAEDALSDIDLVKTALASFNFTMAEQALSSANEKFVSAQKQLDQIKSLLTVLADISPVGNTFKSGKNILELGDNLSGSGTHLLNGLNGLLAKNDASLTTKINNFKTESALALSKLRVAQANLKNINSSDIPEDKRAQFDQIRQWLPVFVDSLQEINSGLDFAVNFLGDNDLKRYLVVFQNDNELRATGGFMGSYALVDFKSGRIDKITIPEDGSYTARAKLTELWQSPKALQRINTRWEFHDSNWWPDYPASAQNIMEFYNKSGGPTIDGVIAINSGWMKNLIAVLGPVDLPGYGKTITADNYEMELQKSIELESTDKSKAKKILGDLSSELLERLFDSTPDKYLAITGVVTKGLSQKEILIYMSDPDLQKFVYDHNWDGRIKDSSFDYLSVISTNIGGGKTDNAIKQNIYHVASIDSDGSIIDTVVINRSHFGSPESFFTKQTSTDYLRVYVPKGSQLLRAVGFDNATSSGIQLADYLKPHPKLDVENNALIDSESGTTIYDESGKTVFANWLTVPLQQSREALLIYKLPYKLNLDQISKQNNFLAKFVGNQKEKSDFYRILIQKQSGQDNVEIVSEIKYPGNFQPSDYLSTMKLSLDRLVASEKLDKDLLYYANFMNNK